MDFAYVLALFYIIYHRICVRILKTKRQSFVFTFGRSLRLSKDIVLSVKIDVTPSPTLSDVASRFIKNPTKLKTTIKMHGTYLKSTSSYQED